MLGFETERKLALLLDTLKESELAQEKRRQRLCLNRDFAPYSAFMRLDRDANEQLTPQELFNFFRDNREYTITYSDCSDLLKYFDADEDGLLKFEEFSQIVLPCEDNSLRAATLKRRHFRVGRFDMLPMSMELELCSILYSEIHLLRRLLALKEELSYRYDYSSYSAFRTIDRYNEGFITVGNLCQFFRNNYRSISEKEALAVIRRIDTDGDAKISYDEFTQFFNVIPTNAMPMLLRPALRASYNNDWRTQS